MLSKKGFVFRNQLFFPEIVEAIRYITLYFIIKVSFLESVNSLKENTNNIKY